MVGHSPENSEWMSDFSRRFALSARQQMVLRMVIGGMALKQMAAELSVSGTTVRRHAQELCRKCGTRGQKELLALIARTLLREVSGTSEGAHDRQGRLAVAFPGARAAALGDGPLLHISGVRTVG
jgi:DNA-binding CsgD family transcriptional regulator